MNYKPKVEYKDRCFKCGSYNVKVVSDPPTWPHVSCKDCGAFVRDFGD